MPEEPIIYCTMHAIKYRRLRFIVSFREYVWMEVHSEGKAGGDGEGMVHSTADKTTSSGPEREQLQSLSLAALSPL